MKTAGIDSALTNGVGKVRNYGGDFGGGSSENGGASGILVSTRSGRNMKLSPKPSRVGALYVVEDCRDSGSIGGSGRLPHREKVRTPP